MRRAKTATPTAPAEPASKNIQFEPGTSAATDEADTYNTIHARQNAKPISTR